MVVLGPGSGLGVAALVPQGDVLVVVPSEGGHATMPASSIREDAILDLLRGPFGHVSAERVLSGPGLENLYQAIITLDGIAAPTRNAAGITVAALKGACPTSRATLEMFCAMLGGFAANAALTCGARGGVYSPVESRRAFSIFLRLQISGGVLRKRAAFGPILKRFHPGYRASGGDFSGVDVTCAQIGIPFLSR